MARPPGRKGFRFNFAQRRIQRPQQRRRHRVVVFAARPIRVEQVEIEIEAAAFHLARERARREQHGRKTRRRAEALLRTGIAGVDVIGDRVKRHRADGRHGVDDEQGVVLARDRADFAGGIHDARRRLDMNRSDEIEFALRLR